MEQATAPTLTAEDLEYVDLSGDAGRERLAEIAEITRHPAVELEHVLLSDDAGDSRGFGVLGPDGRVLGFQGWVAKPLLFGGGRHQSFRSEYTIVSPELRGTGTFGRFYPWTQEQLWGEFGTRIYFWGETAHKAWLKVPGWRMPTRYTYYQVFGGRDFIHPAVVRQMSSRAYRLIRPVASLLSPPPLRRSRHPVEIDASLSFEEFQRFAGAAPRPNRARLVYDERTFRHRFELNPLVAYRFVTCGDTLLIVGEQDGRFGVADLYVADYREYVTAVDAFLEQYDNLVVHGNIRSEWNTAAFWANLRLGCMTLAGGGSFVEHNETLPELELRRLPLHEAYHFGREI